MEQKSPDVDIESWIDLKVIEKIFPTKENKAEISLISDSNLLHYGLGMKKLFRLEELIRIRQHNVSSKDMLKSVLKDQWEKISAEETTRFVSSMLKRLQKVLK
ncbi:hypothetical protein TNCV_5045561 [Trichonephila clavipes]|uniref:Uncharacterized protein n=1 Tax=Trichonephila clavipes TaxID=2585209 RepID=A0A8X6WHH1_TRICX|nr:hypothetical protein TNCV_5045561 [Trichonephila clavipes]